MGLTKAQLERLWINNGGDPGAANTAASIALAESGGNQNATDYDSNGTVDRGYWQINSVHGALSTFDPNANARAAISISHNGTNWSPWVTYQTGAYQQYLHTPGMNYLRAATGGASTTSTSTSTSGSSSSTGSGSSSSSSSGKAPGGIGGFLLKATLTIALVIGGLVLAGVGLKNTLSSSSGKQPAGEEASG